jgi:GTPase SAR1 family protein
MDIINYDVYKQEGQKHHFLLPNSIRMVICGGSGCGKTNLMVNFLLNKGWLNYDQLYIYTNTPYQEKYNLVRQFFDTLKKQCGHNILKFLSPQDIIDPQQLDPKKNNVIVFDDCMQDKQTIMSEYFTQGRHNNCDSFYLTQSYFHIPKHTIRDNANFIIIFRQDKKSLQALYDSHACVDMEFQEFLELANTCTRTKHGFMCIDLTSEAENGKYRKDLSTFYLPKKFIKRI